MNPCSSTLAPALLVGSLATVVSAQTVTVTTLEDDTDFAGAQQVVDLPGPDGKVSFREALTATNNTSGPQTIEFAIPRDEWWLVGDQALVRLETGAFLVTDDETTLDFSSQTAFTGDTNPNGREVGIYGLQPNGWGSPAIIVLASDCVIRGLGSVLQRGASVSVWGGDRNRVVGCVTDRVEIRPYPGTSAYNVIGGTDPADANVLGAIDIQCGADDNLVIGNRVRTVAVVGSQNCSAHPYPLRNRIGGPTPEERNVLVEAGSYSSEGFPLGQNVLVNGARDTLVEGNYIGVEADGMTRVPQVGPTGVEVQDAVNTTVRGNLIAGHRVHGVNHHSGEVFGQAIRVTALNADNLGTAIEDNLIGTDASGVNGILTLNGVVVASATALREVRDTRIGGTRPDQSNTIAFTEQTGVLVLRGAPDVELSGNSIHDNGWLGIDLAALQGADGVTLNDAEDADTNLDGGNALQNFPVLDSVLTTGAALRVAGTLHSAPVQAYRLEFFSNATCDASGHGEGEIFLGSQRVVTDATGNVAFQVELQAGVAVGRSVTATATDLLTDATSEFAACAGARDASRTRAPGNAAGSTPVSRP